MSADSGQELRAAGELVALIAARVRRDTAQEIARLIEVPMRKADAAQIGFSAVGDAYANAARIARSVAEGRDQT